MGRHAHATERFTGIRNLLYVYSLLCDYDIVMFFYLYQANAHPAAEGGGGNNNPNQGGGGGVNGNEDHEDLHEEENDAHMPIDNAAINNVDGKGICYQLV